MSYAYTPQVGYGPFRFGMSPRQARELAGPELSFGSSVIGVLDDPRMDRRRWMDFPETRTGNAFPQIGFDGDRAVTFTLFDRKDPIVCGPVNLFDRRRKTVLHALAALEDDYFEDNEGFFFPRAGVLIPNARYASKLPYVTLVDTVWQRTMLDLDGLDPSRSLSD